MPFDFDHVPSRRRAAHKNKWTWYPADVLPMWIADMDFQSPRPVLDALRRELDVGVLGYELPSRALQETVAGRMERLHGWKVDPEAVLTTTGIVSAFNVAARALCTPYRGYLVQSPVYNEFHTVENNLGIPEYDAPLARTTRRGFLDYEVDWDAFERQITKAGMLLLCNPHNPVGKIFSRGDLRRMAKTCIENDVVIVSDEIHSELLLDDEKFTPVATLSRDIERHTITLVSASKTFNVPGLFCGFAIVPDPRLRERMAKVIDALKMHTNSLGLSAAQAAFSGKCDPWLRALRKYLTGNRDFLIEYARDYLPDIRLTRPQATYLEWLDCGELVSSVRIEGSPFQFFLDEAKLALADGKLYAGDHPDFVRLNFGCPRSTLERGLERMRKALNR